LHDYDQDGDVDGVDFLQWQRGNTADVTFEGVELHEQEIESNNFYHEYSSELVASALAVTQQVAAPSRAHDRAMALLGERRIDGWPLDFKNRAPYALRRLAHAQIEYGESVLVQEGTRDRVFASSDLDILWDSLADGLSEKWTQEWEV
jgi:hypothetical protein